MIYAHIYPYRFLADDAFKEFIRSRSIVSARKNSYACVAITDKKDEHHFMTKERYERWKHGRTYEMNGVIYHSGEQQAEREGER